MMKRCIALLFLTFLVNTLFAQLPPGVPSSSLIGFWPFSGNTNDASGNGLHGIPANTLLISTSDRFNQPNAAYSFNGLSTLVDIPYNSQMGGMNDLSISAWINVDSLIGIQHIVSRWNFVPCGSTGGGDTYAAALIGSDLHLSTNNNTTGFTSPVVLSNSVINTWKHLVFTSSATNGQAIYVDGALAATHNAPGTICASSTNSLFIGASEASGSPFTRYFNGEIDDVGLWKRVLSPCEIFVLYGQGLLPSTAASSNSVCAGSSLTLTAGGLNSYTWMPGNLTGSVVTVAPLSSTVYTVTAANAAGCTVSKTLAVSVVPSNTISLTANANPSIVCPGSSATLSASGATSYTWQPGSLSGSITVVTPSANTVYTLIGEDQLCTAETTLAVNIGREVTVIPFGSFCSSNTVALTVLALSPNDSLQWTGPGIAGSVGGSLLTTSLPGTYSVVVTNTVTGCTGSGILNLPAGLPPINIVPSATQACFPGPPVSLLVSVPANLSWLPASEVSPSSGPLVSVNPSVTSTYTVIATQGTCTAQSVITLSVNALPQPPIVSGDTTVCFGKSLQLSAQGASDFLWLPGNYYGDTLTFSPSHSTTYTVVGLNGVCANSSTFQVLVREAPSLNSFVQPPVICIGQTAVLLATGAPTLAWITADPPPVSATAAVSPSATTQYSVVGTNSLGCSSIATIQVRVINSPAITATASAYTICAGQSVSLTALGVGSHTWQPGSVVADTMVVTPSVSTTYTVMADTTICGNVTIPVNVNNCQNKSLGIALDISPPNQMGIDQFNVNVRVVLKNLSATSFSAVLVRTDLRDMMKYPITYTVLSAPRVSSGSQLVARMNYNGETQNELTDSTSVLLPAPGDTIYFSLRIDPRGFSGKLYAYATATGRDQFGITATDTSHAGLVTDPDGDGDPTNNSLPSAIDLPKIELFIPSGFSPNDDGINDFFVIRGLQARPTSLLIYNRWGNKVYEVDPYENNWDGTSNIVLSLGKGKLPDGIYYYILQFKDGNKEVYKGFVTMKY